MNAKHRGMDGKPHLPPVDEAIAHLRAAAQPGWHHGPAALALIAEVERLRGEAEMLRMMRDADTEKLNEYIDKTREAEGEVVRLRAENERLDALFQRTHHVHWGWVAKAVEAEDARAEEREACANLCDEITKIGPNASARLASSACAQEIRARAQTGGAS